MAHRSLEEVIRTIAPSRRRGIPNPPTIDVGVSGDNGNLANSLSQAGQQIAQLQSAYQQQANLIAENTQALQSNTSSHGGSAGSALGHIASSLFGGALGFLSPIISGITSLFGGGSSTPQALPIYSPPPPVAINGVLQSAPVSSGTAAGSPLAPGAFAPGALAPDALSAAGQQVAQLQSAYELPSAQVGPATNVAANNTASGPFSGALAYPSQVSAGIANLFGEPTEAQLPARTNPGVEPGQTFPNPVSLSASAPPDTPSADTAAALVSQIASGITGLFNDGRSASTQLAIYTPPAAVPLSAAPQSLTHLQPAQSGPAASSQPGTRASQPNAAPQITVNISAMDSQSFMDRSSDIASAVRAAMLNSHPINDVVADL